MQNICNGIRFETADLCKCNIKIKPTALTQKFELSWKYLHSSRDFPETGFSFQPLPFKSNSKIHMEPTQILEAGSQYELCLEFQFVPSGKYILSYKYYSTFIAVKDFRKKKLHTQMAHPFYIQYILL